MPHKTVTYYIRVRKHLVPVSITTKFPASKTWLMQLQHAANRAVWGHSHEFIAQLERDGLDLGVIDSWDVFE